jgi:hypothetical protein
VFSISSLVYFKVAPLQADPQHDGVILAAAIAVSEGHPIHAGVFSQYGPLAPLVQGVFLHFTENSLIALRYFTAIQVLVIGILLYQLLLKISEKKIALTVTASWLLASGIWSTKFPGVLLPWPSLISTLLILCAMLICVLVEVKDSRILWVGNIISGALVGLSGFGRIQSFLMIAAFSIPLLIRSKWKLRNFLLFLGGTAISIICMIGYLTYIGSLRSFVDQFILWPLQIYPNLGSGNRYNRFQFIMILIEALVFISMLGIGIYLTRRRKSERFIKVVLLIIPIIFVSFGFWVSQTTFAPIRYRVLFGEPLERILVSPLYASAVLSVVLFVALVFAKLTKRIVIKVDFTTSLIVIVGACATIQLYPQPDVMHLWWVSPLSLPVLIIAVSYFRHELSEILKKILLLNMRNFSVLGLCLGVLFIYSPWTQYEIPVLKGMYASADKVARVDFYGVIENYAIKGRSSFDCPDGLYSVIDGTYLPADQWFVNWGYLSSTKRDIGSIRFICDQDKDYALKQALQLGMKLKYFYNSPYDSASSLAVLVQ